MPATINDLLLTDQITTAKRYLERAIEAVRRGDEFDAFMSLGRVEHASRAAQRRLNELKFVNALTKESQ